MTDLFSNLYISCFKAGKKIDPSCHIYSLGEQNPIIVRLQRWTILVPS